MADASPPKEIPSRQLPAAKARITGRPTIPIGSRRPGSTPLLAASSPPANKEIIIPIAFSADGDAATIARVRFDQRMTRERLRQLRFVLDALDKIFRHTNRKAWSRQLGAVAEAKRRAARSAALDMLQSEWGDAILVPIFLSDEGHAEMAQIQFKGYLSGKMFGQLGRALAAINQVRLKTKSASHKVEVSATLAGN